MKSKSILNNQIPKGLIAALGLILLVAPIIIQPPLAQAAANLIANPTLQPDPANPAMPLSWQSSGWGNASGAVFSYPAATTPAISLGDAAQVTITNYGAATTGGAAEWYFNSVPVTPNGFYTFSDWYQSTTNSYLIAQFTLSGSSVVYSMLATLPATGGAWANTTQEFSVPENAASMTILHLLQSNGTLAVGNFSLTASAPPSQNLFPQGMVSLTFDDGWISHYDTVLPILKAANLQGTFYIITSPIVQATAAAQYDIFKDPNESITTNTTPSGTTWSFTYPDPTQATYRFSDTYTGSATSTVAVSYTLPGNIASSTVAGILPPGSSQTAQVIISLPTLASSTPITISHTSGSALTVSNPSLTEYQDYITQTQMLALQAAGNELASHTMDHCDLVQLYNNPASALTSIGCPDYPLATSSTATEQIDGAKTALLNMGATPVDTFAYPFGSYTGDVEQLVKNDGFIAARSVDIGYNTKATDVLDLKVQNIDDTSTFATVQPWIDAARANKLWLILVFHQIDNQSTIAKNGETYATTPQIFQQIVNYLKTTNTEVKTVHDAAALINTASSTAPLTVNLNNSAGPAGFSDFNLTVKDNASTLFQGSASSTQQFSVNVGDSYSVTEATTTNSAGYSVAASDCSGTVLNSNPITCSFTNTYAPTADIQILPATLPNGIVGSPYSQNLNASTTASGPFSWSVASGTLPSGLSLNTTATGSASSISGSPSASGNFNFSVKVTNGTSSGTINYTLTVNPPTPGITISPLLLPDAVVGSAYSQVLAASTTAAGPFTWSLASGTLPSGLQIDTTASGTATTIFGTPATTTSSSFTVAVTNGTSSSTASYQLNVALAAAPVIGSESSSAPTTDSITVTWTTNHPASSRVIYDVVSQSILSASSTPPNYGYANSTTEDPALVTSHSVVVGGLSPGTTYYFRPVSDGSPEAVGSEISMATQSAIITGGGGGGGGGGGSGTSYGSSGAENASAASTTASSTMPQVLGAQTSVIAHPNGTLILDGHTVYLIQNGQRYGYRNPAEFMSYGYNFNQVVAANNADLSLPYPQGNILKAMEGTLVLDAADNRTVYMIGSNFTKRGFVSAAVFKALGYSFANLPKINLADYPAGMPVTSASDPHPEGSLVLDGQTVWWVNNNARQGFESEAVFNTYGFSFARTVKANPADLALARGSLVKFRDGTLVNSNGGYNIISDGQALPFASTTVMSLLGYNPANAISSDLSKYQKGNALE